MTQTKPTPTAGPTAVPAGAQASARGLLRGVVYTSAAVFVFAVMDTTGKYLFALYPVPLMQFFRYAINVALLVAIFAPSMGWGVTSTQRTGLVMVRGASLAVASLCAGLALQRMPVGETIAIIYLQPFGVMLAASPILGERVGWTGWLSALVGFLGVLLIARPGSGLDPVGVFFAVTAAVVSIAYQVLSRLLAKTERIEPMLLWTAIAGAVGFGVTLPWSVTGPAPGLLEVVLILSLGVLGTLGHFLFTAAYRHAPATTLAPVNYLHLLWAGLLGALVFGHIPDLYGMLGMSLVAAAGVVAALREQIEQRWQPFG